MSFYFFYQQEPKSVWIPGLADERANIIRDKAPALCTVLDVDSTFDDDMSSEQFASAKYRGPLYFDIDSEDINTAIEQTKKLLTLLQSKGLDLNTLRCFLTGGRGAHILIDQSTFMTKVPPTGTVGLPSIYKEMVWSTLFVDDVDLRVYSAKKGRQLRCANYKRENSLYKVSVTADEILSLTPERYTDLCSSPRNQVPVEPSKFCPELGLAFSMAQDKITKGIAKKKSKKPTSDELKKFGGEWPETLLLLTQGVGVREDVGFNQIAMQIGITGSILGKSEAQILADCEGLIETHKGDSARYGTPSKRRSFLREMIRYCDNSPLYEFSPGAVINLLIPEVRKNSDIGCGDYIPDEPTAPIVKEDGTVVEYVEDEEDNAPIRVTKKGILTRTDSGYVTQCNIGLGRAIALRKMDGSDIGYEVETFKNGKSIGYQTLTMDKLTSRTAFQSFTFTWSCSMSASDIQTAKIADILGRRAEKNNDVTYVVTREGVDLIVPPWAKTEDDFELIWSAPTKVIGGKGGMYRFRSHLDKSGTFKSDLMSAPALTLKDEELIDNLLKMNTTQNLAKLLGWFSAAFLTQIVRRYYKQFPSLQVFGQAGAGKTKSTGLLNHLNYHMKDPKQIQAQGTTMYPLIVAVASSSSQPVIFEEVKAREMTKTLHDFLLNLFRCNYDGYTLARGALTKDNASKDVTVNEFENSGPIVFVGESVESQSALLERCIVVSLTKQDRYGKDAAFHYVADRRTELGRLGKAMVENVLSIDIPKMRQSFDTTFTAVKDSLNGKGEELERPAFNIAVVILGLGLLGDTLHGVFGDRFDERIGEMKDVMLSNALTNIPTNMTEASRVLDVMAQLSRNQDDTFRMVKGVDYTLSSDGKTMDLKLRTAYAKYIKWQRSLGQEAMFDNETAFISGMSSYIGTLKRACPDNSQLFDSVKAIVYRLDLQILHNEGVDSFRE